MQYHKFIQLMPQDLFSKLIETPSAVGVPENTHDGNGKLPELSCANADDRPYDAVPGTGYSDRTVCRSEVLVMNDRSA